MYKDEVIEKIYSPLTGLDEHRHYKWDSVLPFHVIKNNKFLTSQHCSQNWLDHLPPLCYCCKWRRDLTHDPLDWFSLTFLQHDLYLIIRSFAFWSRIILFTLCLHIYLSRLVDWVLEKIYFRIKSVWFNFSVPPTNE